MIDNPALRLALFLLISAAILLLPVAASGESEKISPSDPELKSWLQRLYKADLPHAKRRSAAEQVEYSDATRIAESLCRRSGESYFSRFSLRALASAFEAGRKFEQAEETYRRLVRLEAGSSELADDYKLLGKF